MVLAGCTQPGASGREFPVGGRAARLLPAGPPPPAPGGLVADRPQPFLAKETVAARGSGRSDTPQPLPVPYGLRADACGGGHLADGVVAVTVDVAHDPEHIAARSVQNLQQS